MIGVKAKSHGCNGCRKTEDEKKAFKSCSRCKSVFYCSKKCQQRSWLEHKNICNAIRDLQRQRRDRIEKSGVFASSLSPRDQTTVARLIGEKCLINCRLSKKRTEVLLDTGAQVSLVSQSWLHQHHPDVNIQDIKELMSKEDQPRVRWGNNVEIPYSGYVELQFSLDGQKSSLIDVPFLVIPGELDHPLLGFNVIKALVLDDHCDPTLLVQLFKSSFASNKEADVECLVKLIQRDDCGDVLVRGKKSSLLVKAGQCLNLPCKADMGMLKNKTPMVFQQGDFHCPMV